MDTNTITSAREVIIKKRNDFQEALLLNIMDLRRHEERMKENPKYERQINTGETKTVVQLIQMYLDGAKNSKHYMDICDQMLKEDEAGELQNSWTADELGKVLFDLEALNNAGEEGKK